MPATSALLCRPFVESVNKGPHFWDEDHALHWYTDIYSPIAKRVERGEASLEGPLSIDASSNTFTVSGVNVRGKQSRNVRYTLFDVLPSTLRAIAIRHVSSKHHHCALNQDRGLCSPFWVTYR